MTASTSTAARGAMMLVLSQGLYFIFGYLAVVVLARELGPSIYGVYGVVMSVLVWLEQSGRSAVPSAVVKLLAASAHHRQALEKTAFALNLGLHLAFFALLWWAAPWLQAWFHLDDGVFLFRLAALDLPFFGMYTALQAIHQGHRHFVRLGCSQIAYALAKLAGVLLMTRIGVSLELALLINVGSSVVGLLFLWAGTHLRRPGPWFDCAAPLVADAVPMGLYSIALLLIGSLNLWLLQIVTPASGGAIVGVFVAALNIARVPAFGLASVCNVLLPSASRAASQGDTALVKRYIHQALRFCLILYIPICLVFMAWSETLMLWVYSNRFAGGGALLSVLLAAEGLGAIHAILASSLMASGKARQMALATGVSIAPLLLGAFVLVTFHSALGAAVVAVVNRVVGILIFSVLLNRQYGMFVEARSVANMALASACMALAYGMSPAGEGVLMAVPTLAGMAAYGVALLLLREVGPQDLAALYPGRRAA